MSKGSYFDLKIRIQIAMMVAEANLGPAASYNAGAIEHAVWFGYGGKLNPFLDYLPWPFKSYFFLIVGVFFWSQSFSWEKNSFKNRLERTAQFNLPFFSTSALLQIAPTDFVI